MRHQKHIRQYRINREMLQREVAEIIRVGKWTILLWESNRAKPLVRCYPTIIEFLGYDPTPEPLTPADRVVCMRRRLGLTPEEFAAKLGVDANTVWRWA